MAIQKKSLLGNSPATSKSAHTKSSVAPTAPANTTKVLAASRATALKAAVARVGTAKTAGIGTAKAAGMVTAKRFKAAMSRTGF